MAAAAAKARIRISKSILVGARYDSVRSLVSIIKVVVARLIWLVVVVVEQRRLLRARSRAAIIFSARARAGARHASVEHLRQ